MKRSRQLVVSDKKREVIGGHIVLIRDVGISHAQGELKVQILADGHRVAIGKTGTPEVKLEARLLPELDVTHTTPTI